MRVRYQRRGRNVACALVAGSVACFVLRVLLAPTIPSAYRWGVPAVAVGGAVVVARYLRRGVVVDSTGITQRQGWVTVFIAWSAIKRLRFGGDNGCDVEPIGGGESIRVVVQPTHDQPTLREACAGWTTEHRDFAGEAKRYPREGRDWMRAVFIPSVLALIIGLPVWIEAQQEDDAYAARDARERDGVAVISDVWVKATSDGEGHTDYSTYVAAFLRMEDGRVYDIEVHRPDDLASRYEEEDPLPVVYDSIHPRDADFADGPTRQAQQDSVSLRETTGPLFFFAGLAGALGVGSVMALDWRRRLG